MEEVDTSLWLPVPEAAAKMSISVDALRKRIKREQVQSRLGNDGKAQVLVGVETESGLGLDVGRASAGQAIELEETKEAVERWRTLAGEAREEAAGLRAERDAVQAAVADLRADRNRLAAELAEARKPWLVRLVEAVRRR